jgi:hypothetical protein
MNEAKPRGRRLKVVESIVPLKVHSYLALNVDLNEPSPDARLFLVNPETCPRIVVVKPVKRPPVEEDLADTSLSSDSRFPVNITADWP